MARRRNREQDEDDDRDDGPKLLKPGELPPVLPAVEYPPWPSDRPISGNARVDAIGVMAICQDVENTTPIEAAFQVQGYASTSLDEWRDNMTQGVDPFWAWAVTCVEIAEAVAKRDVSYALRRKAVIGMDTKAMALYLNNRTKDYQNKKVVKHEVDGVVRHEHDVVLNHVNGMLLDGKTSIEEMAKKRRAIADTAGTVIDVQEVPEPHPLFRQGPGRGATTPEGGGGE